MLPVFAALSALRRVLRPTAAASAPLADAAPDRVVGAAAAASAFAAKPGERALPGPITSVVISHGSHHSVSAVLAESRRYLPNRSGEVLLRGEREQLLDIYDARTGERVMSLRPPQDDPEHCLYMPVRDGICGGFIVCGRRYWDEEGIKFDIVLVSRTTGSVLCHLDPERVSAAHFSWAFLTAAASSGTARSSFGTTRSERARSEPRRTISSASSSPSCRTCRASSTAAVAFSATRCRS
jgi:hypothetical protein